MPLYFRQLQRWFPDLPIRDRGYMASEGCGSIPLTDAGCAGALAITTSFFEFIPVEARDQANPPVLTCAELQPNRDYYVLFTTSAGLYRYDINDVIRVVDFYHDVPLIEFVRKGRGMTSLTGEKLAEQQVTAAMLAAIEGLGSDEAIRHFSAVPVFGSPPRYAFFLELGEQIGDDAAPAARGAPRPRPLRGERRVRDQARVAAARQRRSCGSSRPARSTPTARSGSAAAPRRPR